MVTLVANVRGTSEESVAARYTFRQLAHIAEVHVKDRLLVLRVLSEIMSASMSKSKTVGSDVPILNDGARKALVPHKAVAAAKRLVPYSWYRPRVRAGRKTYHRVIGLDDSRDGPLGDFIGKGKIQDRNPKRADNADRVERHRQDKAIRKTDRDAATRRRAEQDASRKRRR